MSQRHWRDGRPYTGRSDPKYYTQEYFSQSYLSGDELRRHEHANPPRLPSINHLDRMGQDVHWYSPDTFSNMVENSRQPRRPTEGFEPFGRRGMKPLRDQRIELPLVNLLIEQEGLRRQYPGSYLILANTKTSKMRSLGQGTMQYMTTHMGQD